MPADGVDDPHSVAARMTVDAEFAPLTSPICASCAARSKDGRRLVAVVGRAPAARDECPPRRRVQPVQRTGRRDREPGQDAAAEAIGAAEGSVQNELKRMPRAGHALDSQRLALGPA